ncbi:MAG: solute carrier family 23 protein [Coriobacteriia bacterium]|nr:solute carrier family 23 protein [Coriobacteriia bacterium]
MAREIQTDEILPLYKAIPLAAQHLMAMFGATVLVPILTGLNPSVAIMTSGAGTILYLILTKGKIPSFLGSSFAFIAPIAAVAGVTNGIADPGKVPYALGGLVVAGLVYVLVAAIIKAFGTKWLYRVLPPALVGAVVIIIGLGLAGIAIKMSLFPFANPELGLDWNLVAVAAITLGASIAFSSYFKGFISTIPILLGIIVGYLAAIPFGLVNFAPVLAADWFGLPTLTIAKFEFSAIMLIAPVALVVIIEHIGHLLVINEVTGKDFNPLLPQSLAGDGLATSLSALVGGTPSTTYAENIGVMAVTRIYAVQIFWYAGALAFVIGGFVPKVGALISSIPTPVMGGVSVLLFGLIASSGLRMLVNSGIDYSHSRNLILSSVVLVLGIGMEVGEIKIPLGDYTVPGMALATLVGVILNLILPAESKGLAIDSPDFDGGIQAEAAHSAE